MSFDEKAEDLAWSSLEINLIIEETTYGCSFGAQSNSTIQDGKVSPKLGADGSTFTTEIDATDSESYTHFDLPGQFGVKQYRLLDEVFINRHLSLRGSFLDIY